MKYLYYFLNFIVVLIATGLTFFGFDLIIDLLKKGEITIESMYAIFLFLVLPVFILGGAILALMVGFNNKLDLRMPLAMLLFFQAWGFHSFSIISLVLGILALYVCMVAISKYIKIKSG